MHVAIAVGTLLLGGWVLNSPTDPNNDATAPAQVQPPTAGAEALPRVMDRGTEQPAEGTGQAAQGRGQSGQGRGASQMRSRSMTGSQAGRGQRRMSTGMPLAPTDMAPPGSEGMFGQPAAPTTSIQGPGSYTPAPPTQRRKPPSELGYHPTSHGNPGRGAPPPSNLGNVGSFAPPPAAEKAFSGYHMSSGVSPYMNLFRRSGETVDNYSTLVRPQLDQRYQNQQFSGDIRGLQNNTRTQGVNLQNLNRDTRALQGVGTPQYYQNTQGYFPGNGQ
jgi:hypothetical protein